MKIKLNKKAKIREVKRSEDKIIDMGIKEYTDIEIVKEK